MTAKTYHAMIPGSRYEFTSGRQIHFVGAKGQTGTYTTSDPDEIAELDKVAKTVGSGVSSIAASTVKEASSGIAADILAKAQAAQKSD